MTFKNKRLEWMCSQTGLQYEHYHIRMRNVIYLINSIVIQDKKAELSQRWPRDAPYIWVPWKFHGVPDYAHGWWR